MTSLGRVGRILAGSVDVSGISIDRDISHMSISQSSQPSGNSVSSISPELRKADESTSQDGSRESPLPPQQNQQQQIGLQGKNSFSQYVIPSILSVNF